MRRRHGCGKGGVQQGADNRFSCIVLAGFAGNGRPFQHSAWNISGRLTFSGHQRLSRRTTMFGWALTFLIVALIAAVLGFGGIAGFAVEIAQLIFYVAIILLVISVVVGLIRGRTPTVP
jgi:uncharacterized membrane protein YtjA (UPF0391 family)